MTAPTRPTPAAVRAQIDHVHAAILGIQDGINLRLDRERQGKKTDNLAGFRNVRLRGFQEVLGTLQWVLVEVER